MVTELLCRVVRPGFVDTDRGEAIGMAGEVSTSCGEQKHRLVTGDSDHAPVQESF